MHWESPKRCQVSALSDLPKAQQLCRKRSQCKCCILIRENQPRWLIAIDTQRLHASFARSRSRVWSITIEAVYDWVCSTFSSFASHLLHKIIQLGSWTQNNFFCAIDSLCFLFSFGSLICWCCLSSDNIGIFPTVNYPAFWSPNPHRVVQLTSSCTSGSSLWNSRKGSTWWKVIFASHSPCYYVNEMGSYDSWLGSGVVLPHCWLGYVPRHYPSILPEFHGLRSSIVGKLKIQQALFQTRDGIVHPVTKIIKLLHSSGISGLADEEISWFLTRKRAFSDPQDDFAAVVIAVSVL